MVVLCCVMNCRDAGKHRVKTLVKAETSSLKFKNYHSVPRMCQVGFPRMHSSCFATESVASTLIG